MSKTSEMIAELGGQWEPVEDGGKTAEIESRHFSCSYDGKFYWFICKHLPLWAMGASAKDAKSRFLAIVSSSMETYANYGAIDAPSLKSMFYTQYQLRKTALQLFEQEFSNGGN